MPRTLARLPYGKNTKPIEEFGYEEVALDKSGNSVTVAQHQKSRKNTAYVIRTR
jgi:type VI secretion system protein ImpC